MKAVRILLVEYEGGALHNNNVDKLTENKAFQELVLPLGGLCIESVSMIYV